MKSRMKVYYDQVYEALVQLIKEDAEVFFKASEQLVLNLLLKSRRKFIIELSFLYDRVKVESERILNGLPESLHHIWSKAFASCHLHLIQPNFSQRLFFRNKMLIVEALVQKRG